VPQSEQHDSSPAAAAAAAVAAVAAPGQKAVGGSHRSLAKRASQKR